jgi:hypothetical protein
MLWRNIFGVSRMWLVSEGFFRFPLQKLVVIPLLNIPPFMKPYILLPFTKPTVDFCFDLEESIPYPAWYVTSFSPIFVLCLGLTILLFTISDNFYDFYIYFTRAASPSPGSKHLWNVGRFLLVHTAQNPRRQHLRIPPPWEPEISPTICVFPSVYYFPVVTVWWNCVA